MRNKSFLVITVIIIISGLAFIGYQLYEQRREEARVAEEQREIEEAYRWVHHAIGRIGYATIRGWVNPYEFEEMSTYRPLDSFRTTPNEFGIFYRIYVILRMYYHRGGVYLSYEKLIDYFSKEFEPDGSLRLYNNGNHPEIEAFVKSNEFARSRLLRNHANG